MVETPNLKDKKMKVKNLTPHVLNVVTPDGSKIDIHPERGMPIPRVDMAQASSYMLSSQYGVIEVSPVVLGKISDLPPQEDGVMLIVSRIVMEAAKTSMPDRKDLLTAGAAIRDGSGVVIGCRGLSQ